MKTILNFFPERSTVLHLLGYNIQVKINKSSAVGIRDTPDHLNNLLHSRRTKEDSKPLLQTLQSHFISRLWRSMRILWFNCVSLKLYHKTHINRMPPILNLEY